MDKETSSRVSSIASSLANFQLSDLDLVMGDDTDKQAEFCGKVRTLAGSALSQDETPGQEPEYKTTAKHRDMVGLGEYLFSNLPDDPDHLEFEREGTTRLIDHDDLSDFWNSLDDQEGQSDAE